MGGVTAVIELLGAGNTVPFVARYRKERTGGLDEVQIRDIRDRHAYLAELASRKKTILETISQQGKLTPELRRRIEACTAKTELEDLYLPYKPKRRTRAMIARERGLGPLADQLMDPTSRTAPDVAARAFVNAERGVADIAAALAGARDIFAEDVADRAEVRSMVRSVLERDGMVETGVGRKKPEGPTKFEDYYDYSERIAKIPSHRYLAICRGEAEGVLKVNLGGDDEGLVAWIDNQFRRATHPGWRAERSKAIADAYKRIVKPSVSTDLRVALKLRSDGAAVEVFADNLDNLLLAPPLGRRATIGIDPGFRTGCKCAVLDDTGRFITDTTIYPSHRRIQKGAGRPRADGPGDEIRA